MDWTEGYAAEVEYDAAFHESQAPLMLNLVAALRGVSPIPLDQPFNYLELGCGRGLTVSVLAAAHPQAHFYANDFNPSHIANADRLAKQAELNNLTLSDLSFADIAAGKLNLPQFDFITLHGIYIWVNAQNRQYLVDIIARHLKPGGLLYVSYNALPGWSAAMPLQRLLLDRFNTTQGTAANRAHEAVDFSKHLQRAHSVYLRMNPLANRKLDQLEQASAAYLTHEFMHPHWQPLYHADVVKDLTPARVNYLGSTTLALNFSDLCLAPSQRQFLSEVADPVLRETLKDYCLNTDFREDVFVRGVKPLNPLCQDAWMANLGLVACVEPEQLIQQIEFAMGPHALDFHITAPLMDALAKGPATLRELTTLPGLREQPFGKLVRYVLLLISSKQLMPYLPLSAEAPTSAMRFNRCVAADAKHGGDHQALASGLTGSGVSVDHLEKLVYDILQPLTADMPLPDPDTILDRIETAGALPELSGDLKGATLKAQWQPRIAEILRVKLPLWRHLRAC